MKSTAVIRIIIWSVTAFLLTALLISVLLFGSIKNLGDWSFGITGEKYANSEKYSVGGGNVSDFIDTLKINWVSGEITVIGYDGDTIEISETGSNSDENKLRYLSENGTLTIQAVKAGVRFGFNSLPKKKLTGKIPEAMRLGFKKIDIESTSAEIKINEIGADTIEIDTVSGNAWLEKIKTESLKCETVSGDIKATGEVGRLESDSVSGEISVMTSAKLKKVETESVSGDITLEIPEDNGFTLEIDTASGDLECDLPLTVRSDKKAYLDGGAEFDINSVSGDIIIKAAK